MIDGCGKYPGGASVNLDAYPLQPPKNDNGHPVNDYYLSYLISNQGLQAGLKSLG